MSTKSTVFLTRDNEHCYTDCNEPRNINEKYIGDDLILEIDNTSIADFHHQPDENGHLIITIKAGTHLHSILTQLRIINEDEL